MLIGGASNVLSFGIGGGSLKKVGGNVVSTFINNAKDDLFKNTTRLVGGKIAKKLQLESKKYYKKLKFIEPRNSYITERRTPIPPPRIYPWVPSADNL